MDSFIFLVKLIKFNELFFIYFVRYFLYVFTYLDSITVLPRSFKSCVLRTGMVAQWYSKVI